jgi:hypothetical protein
MGSTTAEAVAKPAMPTGPAMLAMLMESTPKTADKPATVVGITIAKPIVVGIPALSENSTKPHSMQLS